MFNKQKKSELEFLKTIHNIVTGYLDSKKYRLVRSIIVNFDLEKLCLNIFFIPLERIKKIIKENKAN